MSDKNKNKDKSIEVKSRDLILDGIINEESIRKSVEKIIEVNRHDEKHRGESSFVENPINIIVNTYGGSIYDSNMMIGTMESSKTPIYTYCHGKAMSGGFYIFSAGHRRFATPLATFMYHDMSLGEHDTVEGIKYNMKHYVELRDRYDEYMINRTNIPRELLDYKKERKQDWFMTADEAYKYGLVDEIIPFRSWHK